jgi:uncharacterized protein YlxP (DUF503 family)
MEDVRVHTGTLVADLVLRGCEGLKERRGVLRPVVEKLRSQGFAVAQVGPADLLQRVFLAVTEVSGNMTHLEERLDDAERRLVASEFEVANLQREYHTWSDSSLR